MTVMVVAHPIPGFSGYVRVEDVGLAFIGGFTGPIDVPSYVQTQLTDEGYTLNATPLTDYGPQYVTNEDLEDEDSAASVTLRAASDAEKLAVYSPAATLRGAYDAGVTYELGDVVSDAGELWLAQTAWESTVARTNHQPNPTFRGGQRNNWSLSGSVAESFPVADTIRLTLAAEKASGSSLLIRAVDLAATPGEVWSHGIRVAVPAAAPNSVTVRVSVAIIRSVGGNTSTVGPTQTIAPGGSARITLDGHTLPADTIGIRLAVMTGVTTPTGSVLDVSQTISEKATTIGAYFDGDTSNTADTAYAWAGARDNSASTATVTVEDERGAPGGNGWADITEAIGATGPASPVRTATSALFEPAAPDHATYYPTYMDRNDRTTMISYNQHDLRFSRDDGDTWTLAHTFADTIRSGVILDNGEVLAATRIDDNSLSWRLWLSSGFRDDPTAATWAEVLVGITLFSAAPAGFASWSHHGNIVVVGEYGPKIGTAGATDGARYVYLSRDHGKTFTVIFDLFTDHPATDRTTGMHIHGVCYDPYWDRIWITHGDDENGTLYSDDLGETWQVAHFSNEVTGPNQVVGIIALQKCVLFATDGQPNGVMRIDRTQGKHTGTYEMTVAYLYDDEPILSQLCQSIWRANRPGDDAPVVMSFVKAPSGVGPWWLLTTVDGYTFTKVWEDDTDTPANRTGNAFGPTSSGRLLFYAADDRFGASGRTRWRGAFPSAY